MLVSGRVSLFWARRLFGVAAKARLSLSPWSYNDLCRPIPSTQYALKESDARVGHPIARRREGVLSDWLPVTGIPRVCNGENWG